MLIVYCKCIELLKRCVVWYTLYLDIPLIIVSGKSITSHLKTQRVQLVLKIYRLVVCTSNAFRTIFTKLYSEYISGVSSQHKTIRGGLSTQTPYLQYLPIPSPYFPYDPILTTKSDLNRFLG